MAESKFTKGPWHVDGTIHRNGLSYRIIGGDNVSLGFTATVLNPCHNFETIKANAELMADAPRLLRVLRQVLEYSDISQSWLTIDEAEQAFDDANELIEKHGG